jgi:hypothetical protein
MFLIDRLSHGVEGYSDRDLSASTDGGLQAECAAELAGTLLHYRDTEVPSARCGPVGHIESSAVIADGEIKSITFILEIDSDGRRVGMTDSVRNSLLTDTNKVMDAAWGKRYFVSFDVECGSDDFLHVICGECAGECLRENVCDLLGVA